MNKMPINKFNKFYFFNLSEKFVEKQVFSYKKTQQSESKYIPIFTLKESIAKGYDLAVCIVCI